MGPGGHLHKILKRRFRQDIRTGCKCALWIKKMDERGPVWCRRHLPHIVGKLRQEATKRGWGVATRIPGHRLALRGIVLLAISRSERDAHG